MTMTDTTQEKIFQNDLLEQMQSQGWLIDQSRQYNKALTINFNLEGSENA